jgi:glutathione S-transferase
MLLYSAPLSLFARKVETALGEKGLQYDRVLVPFTQTEGYSPKHPGVLAANPKSQVPVLVDGDLTLYDSTVILEYCEDAYPEPALYPRDPMERARCRLLELEADEVLLAPVRTLMFRTEPPGPDASRRQQQEFEAGKAEALIGGNYQLLNHKLADRDFFCGCFTVADIAIFMIIHYALRLGGPSLPRASNLLHWYERLAVRPAFAAVIAEIADADRALSYPVKRPA